jgi:DNA-binding beta-propeller fold protein YncE
VVGGVDLGLLSNPWEVAPAAGRQAYVTEWEADRVSRIDWGRGTVEARIPVPPNPQGVAVLGERAYVASVLFDQDRSFQTPGVVSIIEADTVVAVVRVGRNPQSVLVIENEIHVICSGPLGADQGIVMIIDPEAQAVVDSILVGGNPAFGARHADALYLSGFYGGLLKVDWRRRVALNDSRNPVLPLEGLFGLDVDPLTGRLYVVHFADDLLLVVEGDSLVAHHVVGDGPQRAVVRRPLPTP